LAINGIGSIDIKNNSSGGAQGSFTNQAGGSVLISGDVAGTVISSGNHPENALFTNQGTLVKSGSSSNHTTTITTPFANTGTVDVQSGKLSFSSFPTNSGMVKLSSSEIVISGTSTFVAGSEISGSGTITTGGLVINGGAVSPGNAAGI
jgi:hypothetical protein